MAQQCLGVDQWRLDVIDGRRADAAVDVQAFGAAEAAGVGPADELSRLREGERRAVALVDERRQQAVSGERGTGLERVLGVPPDAAAGASPAGGRDIAQRP